MKKGKKFICSFISLLMIFVIAMPINVKADDGNAAMVNEVEYASLQEAIDAAKVGETVTLLKDLLNEDVSGPADRMTTIDLNGFSLKGIIKKTHDLCIKDTSTGETKGTAYFSYLSCNVLNLDSGTIVIDDSRIYHTVRIVNANVTINGGEYFLGGVHTSAIDFADESNGSLTVNSGLFATSDNLPSTIIDRGEGETLRYAVGMDSYDEIATVELTSGDKKIYFTNLYIASNAAHDGDTITFLRNQTVDRMININCSVIIDGAGYFLTTVDEPLKNLSGNSEQYSVGIINLIGDNKNVIIKNTLFANIDKENVLIRAYNSGNDSTLTIDSCSFNTLNVNNVIRIASSVSSNAKLVVKNSQFEDCSTYLNGIIMIDNSNTSNALSEIIDNDFVNNSINVDGNAAVIYLSAPAIVKGNYFSDNRTQANESAKNGIIVTGSNAVGSVIAENAFLTHTFLGNEHGGAIYGAKGNTTVENNFYEEDVEHLANASDDFIEGKVAIGYNRNEDRPGVTVILPEERTPNTGDDCNLMLWISLMTISGCSIVYLFLRKRKEIFIR